MTGIENRASRIETMRGLGILFFLYSVMAAGPLAVAAEVSSSFWQTNKSQHFIIYYQEAPAGYINQLIDIAEKYYDTIVEDLGYRRFDFWSWDKRAKIFLYAGSKEYLKDTNRTAWSGASVDIKNRTIKTYIGQENFFDSILPHELTHIVFREFVGPKKDYPLWMDEGVACSQEKKSLDERLKTIRNLIRQGVYIEFKDLYVIRDYSLVVPNVFYSEAASLIYFLLQAQGREKFLDFSRRLRENIKWQNALLETYRFKDVEEFEAKWKEYFLN